MNLSIIGAGLTAVLFSVVGNAENRPTRDIESIVCIDPSLANPNNDKVFTCREVISNPDNHYRLPCGTEYAMLATNPFPLVGKGGKWVTTCSEYDLGDEGGGGSSEPDTNNYNTYLLRRNNSRVPVFWFPLTSPNIIEAGQVDSYQLIIWKGIPRFDENLFATTGDREKTIEMQVTCGNGDVS